MKIRGKTAIYGIIGNPVEHTLSPAMHNAAFDALKLDFAFLPFPCKRAKEAIWGARALGIKGLAVTAPFKKEAAVCCREIYGAAKTTGVVNTLLLEDKILGYNTDVNGFYNSFIESDINHSVKRATIIGGGGASKSAVAALTQLKGGVSSIVILARDPKKAEASFKEDTHISGNLGFFDLNSTKGAGLLKESAIIINTTPVGLINDAMPFDPVLIKKNHLVFDANYRAGGTLLLRKAKEKGCRIIGGERLLINQAVKQFEIFTGIKPDRRIMEKGALEGLEKGS